MALALRPWLFRQWKRWQRLSPLTARILAVNSLPLALLLISILYFSGYQDTLIRNELDSMRKEAHQFAAALGEGAVILSEDERDLLSPELAQKMARRLAETADQPRAAMRTRLFDIRGSQISDSLSLPGRRSSIQREELPPLDRFSALRKIWQDFLRWWRARSFTQAYPPYQENPDPSSQDYPVVEKALDGDAAGQVWLLPNGRLLLGMAVPIQRYKSVLGAVLMTKSGDKIAATVNDVNMDILQLFLLTLVLTILLSSYLARTLAQPLRALAQAAKMLDTEKMGSPAWKVPIPDFSKRGDEIGDLSTALRAMVQALGQRLHSIESFAADVAHEIKNPLTSMHSAVETALRISDPERQKQLLRVMADDVRRLDRLISDISQASRLEGELSRTPANRIRLQELLSTVAELYESHDAGSAPHAPVMLEGAVPNVMLLGVESRLGQVFRNLIDNALSFTPLDGQVRLAARVENGRVHITISDQGPGIPENKKEAIFERFYSERPSGEKFGQHSGLGLSIARQIVQAHQGRLWVENIYSPAGAARGACFHVELPKVEM
ncbi:MAG: stimulus-sensing domain-containing protein [Proteobacteria bacterium]|nr:stimulus-sensing domain-containing protein [Pseudomonadota bacterium]